MLELYYIFFDKFCDVNKFEELEMDTYSLYSALAEEDLDDCILSSNRGEWIERRSQGCQDNFRADAKIKFFPVFAVLNKRNKTKENQDC